MKASFTPGRIDKWRALGILLAGISLLLALLFVPVLHPWWQVESRLSALRGQIEATQALQAHAPEIEHALQAARGGALSSGLYMPEPTVPLGNAALAIRLQEAVDASTTDTSACVLGNRLPIEASGKSSCPEARIKAELQCGTVSLEKVLRALETQPPRLRIERMELVLAPNSLGFDKGLAANTPVNVSLEVAGCLLAAPASGNVPLAAP